METLSFFALALSAATLVVTILIAIRLKTVHYLLQQPVVKKISPQLRLKPVKLDEAGNRRDRNGNGNGNANGESRREGREGREGRDGRREGRENGRRENREPRAEGERRDGRENREARRDGREGRENREPRAEGERREGRDGRENRDGRREGRESREGREGRENREGRRENRENREPRAEGERREGRENRESRGEGREGRETRAPREAADAPRVEAPHDNSAAPAPAGLPPRRPPLPTQADTSAPASAGTESSPASFADATFVGQSDDVQHGRRTQLKKKPRFDIEDETPPVPSV